MLKIDEPIIIDEQMGTDMPDCPNRNSPKCSECGEELNNQASHIIRMFAEKYAEGKNEPGRENLSYIPYYGLGNSNAVQTKCLRIDYQASAVNADNIQMQLGGNKCRVNGRKTTIAALIIEGPGTNRSNQKVSYHKSRVVNAFVNSYESWKNGSKLRFRIRQP
jgi:hypothetical protein